MAYFTSCRPIQVTVCYGLTLILLTIVIVADNGVTRAVPCTLCP